MAKIIWSPKAINALGRICDYIGENSEYYTRLFAENVFKRIEQLVLFPYSGRIVPEYNQPDLRELIYQNYRIIYRVKKDFVEIVWITHGARLLPEDLADSSS
ncbi:MAG: type II toxin-antitoxin system RelE/ParE family toxin [Methanophagales archaeon]|nr:type II toxin-antitoxin system RelE/ParE family toxin [Methanophagales archaeon]